MAFQKGQIANPLGGRHAKKQKEKQLKDMLLKYVPQAVAQLALMLKDPDHKAFAVKEILDRVYGKASQSVELGNKSNMPFTAVISFGTPPESE